MAPEPTCPDSSGCKQVIHAGGLGGTRLPRLLQRNYQQVPPGGLAFDLIQFKEEFKWMRLVHHF
jgi:hypothetical protein